MIACICGGTIEGLLVMAGFTLLAKFFAKKHNKKNCKCCKENKEKKQNE